MSRLSIEVPDHQHKQIKALAALHGQSLKDYIIEKTIPTMAQDDEEAALKEFLDFLAPRIESARQRRFSTSSIEEIIKKAKSQRHSRHG